MKTWLWEWSDVIRWVKIQALILQRFWSRWRHEYFNLLVPLSLNNWIQQASYPERRRGFGSWWWSQSNLETGNFWQPKWRKRWPGSCCKHWHERWIKKNRANAELYPLEVSWNRSRGATKDKWCWRASHCSSWFVQTKQIMQGCSIWSLDEDLRMDESRSPPPGRCRGTLRRISFFLLWFCSFMQPAGRT